MLRIALYGNRNACPAMCDCRRKGKLCGKSLAPGAPPLRLCNYHLGDFREKPMNRRIIPTMLLVLAMVLPARVARAEVDWADTSIQDQPTTTSSYETAANDSETQGEVGALETPSDLADGGFTDTLDSSDGTCDPRRNPCESSMTTSSSSSEGGTASASGCRTVDAWKNHYTLFRTLAYRFHHTKRWCWSSNRITSVSTSTLHLSRPNVLSRLRGSH